MIKKPMLAATLDNIKTVKYPVLCTPKLDGIRSLVVDKKAVSRKFKPIPNHHIRTSIEQYALEGFDGEIIVKGKQFNEISSAVMSEAGNPNFTYVVFDYYSTEGYNNRMRNLFNCPRLPCIEYLLPVQINNEIELLEYESKCLNEGYEGVMLREPNGPYKFGRSTLREGYLLKFKRFTDSEAVILGMYEQMSNQNKATENALGHTERSSNIENLVPANTLGGFRVRDVKSGIEFRIGTGDGLDTELRKKVWNNQQEYLGKIVKYKSQKSGEKDLPRFPVFLGFRSEIDM